VAEEVVEINQYHKQVEMAVQVAVLQVMAVLLVIKEMVTRLQLAPHKVILVV
jgi:hypothetical protein